MEFAAEKKATSNSSGVWSLTLERNSGLVPSGSYWEIEERVPTTDGKVESRMHNIVVGASNQTLKEALSDPVPVSSALVSSIPMGTATAKGDMLAAAAASDIRRLPVGSNEQVLIADSAETTGVKWSALASIPGSTVESYTKAGLPAPTAGKLARVSDDTRGLWMGQGTQWFSLSGNVVNVKEFGAKGDGVTDDTTALAAAITAAGASGTIVLSVNGVYATSGITLLEFTKIDGNGATLIPTGNNQTLLTIPTSTSGLQANNALVLRNLYVDGKSNLGRTGIVGVLMNNHAQVKTFNLVVTKCATTGIDMRATQFSAHYSTQVYDCGVGIKVYSVSGSGGGNSNSFYDPHIVGNTVGYCQIDDSAFPHHSNYLWNPTVISNSVCGIAVFGGNGAEAGLYVIGGAPESNATGAATATVDSKTVKKSAVYVVMSHVHISDCYIADATANPWALLETASRLTLKNISGYGLTTGRLVSADTTSSVVFDGTFGSLGQSEGVASYPAGFAPASETKLIGAPLVNLSSFVRNDFTGDALAPAGTHTGAVSDGFTVDAEQGYVKTVQHAASVGTSETNRINFGNVVSVATGVTSDILVSFLVRASVDCTYRMAGYANVAAAEVGLKAGKWQRVILFAPGLSAGVGFTLNCFPTDSTGPEVRFSKLQVLAVPTDSVEQRNLMSLVVREGLVNHNRPSLREHSPLSAAPTVGTWRAGDVVFASAPATNIGWVCTVAGTPGTWKAFGYIQDADLDGGLLSSRGVTNTGLDVYVSGIRKLLLRAATSTNQIITGSATNDTCARIPSGNFLFSNDDGNNIFAQIAGTIADTETALLVRRNVGGTLSLQRVSMGAADSGGSGFKVLRIPN